MQDEQCGRIIIIIKLALHRSRTSGWCSGYSGQYCYPYFSKGHGFESRLGHSHTSPPNRDGILSAALWLPGGGSPKNKFRHIVVWQANK